MVCLAGNQVWWTWEVEDTFQKVKKGAKTALKDYARRLHGQIGDLVVKVNSFEHFPCIFSAFQKNWRNIINTVWGRGFDSSVFQIIYTSLSSHFI